MKIDFFQLPEAIRDPIYPEPNTGCWLRLSSINKAGYSHYQPVFRGKTHRAHRWVYEFFYGYCPKELDHICRTKCCVNPLHLEPVTHLENIQRWAETETLPTHCSNGHEYTPENTAYWDKRNLNHRCCRQCAREANRRSWSSGRKSAWQRMRRQR